MAGLLTSLLPLAALLPGLAAALPDVTPYQVGVGSCVDYPASTYSDSLGGFFLIPDQADNSTIDGLHTSVDPSDESVITITANLQEAKELFGCTDAAVHELHNASPVLYISAENGQLAFSDAGLGLETYEHQVAGVTQDGKFLGSGGVTAWAYRYVAGGGFHGYDAFDMRLLEAQDGELEDGEFYGFLKIVAVSS